MMARRFPSRLYRSGDEPDPRFTLANERTFLAWIRTALALLAGGVALEALGLPVEPTLRAISSFALLVSGTVVPLLAWLGWYRTESALRHHRRLPAPTLAAPLAVVIAVVAVLLIPGSVGP